MNLKKKDPWVMHTIEMYVMSDYTIHVGWPYQHDDQEREPIKLINLDEVKNLFAPFFRTKEQIKEHMANDFYRQTCEDIYNKEKKDA